MDVGKKQDSPGPDINDFTSTTTSSTSTSMFVYFLVPMPILMIQHAQIDAIYAVEHGPWGILLLYNN
jgi:hypothetical protein